MATAEQTYSYLAPSSVTLEDGRSEVTFATSGGSEAHPYFFTGFLAGPLQCAQALLVVAEVARTRYYEPPQMIASRIAAADPVVTSNVDRLRFESFSACAGVYARLDLEPGTLDGRPQTWGTTNVDFPLATTTAAPLPGFVRWYNRRRPHGSLGGRPPISRVSHLWSVQLAEVRRRSTLLNTGAKQR